MELEHSFTVPVPKDRAWDVLLNVERVAPCMPGASLDSVDGDEIAGRIKVRVGPISMTYAGTAKFTERDREAGVVTLEASGKETRGAGTASASVRSQLSPDGDQTHVTVHTTLNVTGKPAQFGRGVMAEVGGKLIGIFADNLAGMIAAEPAVAGGEPAAGGGDAEAAGGEPEDEDEADVTGNGGESSVTGDEALPIDVLNLPIRAWNSLRRDGIQTLGDLIKRTPEQLLAIGNIGPASLTEITSRLADRGLVLTGSDTGQDVAAIADAARVADTGQGDLGTADSAEGSGQAAAGATAAERAAANGGGPANAGAAPAQREPVGWQPQDDAIDLLGVAGLPVLKRAVPAVAGALALILVVLGVRRRRARRG
jgi:carbon monoxide dehydrogenase subunit G